MPAKKNKKILYYPEFLLLAGIFLLFSFSINSQNIFSSEPHVRVRIINTLQKLDISFNSPWRLTTEQNPDTIEITNGVYIAAIKNDSIVIQNAEGETIYFGKQLTLISNSDSGTVTIADIPYGVGWWWADTENRTYEGLIKIYSYEDNTFEVVVSLSLEEYLKGVIPYEIGNTSPLEALKVQAVAARSEAIVALNSGMYSGEHFDLTSDVECQVFSGNRKRTNLSDEAVEQTRGIILTENGEPINAYYASNCGGHSELIANVWPERPDPESYKIALKDNAGRQPLDLSDEKSVRDWIFSEPEVYCNPNLNVELPSWSRTNFRWKKDFTVDSLTKMISGENDYGKLQEIKPLKRGKSGRMYLCRFVFEKDSFEVKSELAIRLLWKPALRSACFVVDKKNNHFILNGSGWGHGVGMCQSGAVAQAILGKDYKSILRHYYQKAKLYKMY